MKERGDHMPKGSKEQSDARKEEIVDACERLYAAKNFKEITLKEIGAATSFTRTSIYNYFETKEEIFLALLKREYEKWIAALRALADQESLSSEEFASALARTLEERRLLLRLMTMNNYDMEASSRPENLAEFKEVYGQSIYALDRCFAKFVPSEGEREELLYIFLPFVYGIYPYAEVTERQREAMARAGVPFVYHSIYELVYSCVKNLLKGKGD